MHCFFDFADFENMGKNIKVATVQAEPVWLDLQGSVDKVIDLIQEASSKGANVLGFPQLFVPGYPWYAAPKIRK